jgi:two-component system cell cycle sensor histidine kinase/response regulator CckA
MTAKDGVQAQHLVLKDGAPDLVITDESMPRMSGHEFAHWVRASFPAVKVLFLTGYVDHAARASADLSQQVGYLEKPCTLRALLHAVTTLIGPTGPTAPSCAQSAQ